MLKECGFFSCTDSMITAAIWGMIGGGVLYYILKARKADSLGPSSRYPALPR